MRTRSKDYLPAPVEENESKKFNWSEWKRPLVAISLSFLCNVENGMLAMGEWPYMSSIDPEVTSNFFGNATAASKAVNVAFTFLFAIWSHKIHGIKKPMIIGRCITLAACVMYILVEFAPTHRRWWMLVCYLFFGVGFGTGPLLRSYMARVTSEENRSTAYALMSGAMVMSIVIGPLAQLAFTGLPYPGALIIPPNIKLNIYTAPIWCAVITNIAALAVSVFVLEDTVGDEIAAQQSIPSSFSLATIKDRLSNLRSLDIPWLLAVLVIIERMASNVFNTTMAVIAGPMMMSMYALSGQELIMLMGISQIIVGSLAFGFSLMFFICKLGKRVSCRALFLSSNIVMIVGYIITYPYPFSSNPMQPFNETSRTGCNPLEYSWCETQLIVSKIPQIIIMIVASSFAVPSTSMSLDTLYSKIIGNIDQNIMQSVFVIANDVMSIFAPILASSIFTSYGMNFIKIINGSVYIIASILWIVAWKRLQPYD